MDGIGTAAQQVLAAEAKLRARGVRVAAVVGAVSCVLTTIIYTLTALVLWREFIGAVIFTYGTLGGIAGFVVTYHFVRWRLRRGRAERVHTVALEHSVDPAEVESLLF